MKTWLSMIMASLAICCGAMALPDSAEPVLSDANLLTGFVRIDPDDKKPETLPTKAWLWQEGDDLMVRFEAAIDSSFTRGSISVKDEGTLADYLRVQLITIPDAYYAYYYEAYPLGNLADGVRDEKHNVDFAWDSHYSYESYISSDTWTVTMRIPLGELRFRQEQPYRWKIILGRYSYQNREYHSQPYAVAKMGKDYFLKAQDIELSTPVRHKLDITFKPYFVKSYNLIDRTSSWDPEHVGLDIAFNPGRRTRIKLALNPDYSDVPMDRVQDDYNTIKPPYYEENRFFFTEDIDAFGLDYDVLNTRNIVQPRLAFKATGNTKALNWGVVGAHDKDIRYSEELIEPGDYFLALAINPNWRRFNMSNGFVSRVNKGYYNHVYSGSMEWEYLPHFYVNSAVNLSIRDSEAEELTEPQQGCQVGFGLRADPGDFDISAGLELKTRDLAYDAGYLYEKDNAALSGTISWSKGYADKKVRNASLSGWYYGYLKDLSLEPYYVYESGFFSRLHLDSRFVLLANASLARIPDLTDNLHDVYNGMLGCTWARLSNLVIYAGYMYGNNLVYQLSGTYPQHGVNINAWAAPLKNMSLSLVGSWNKFGYDKLTDPDTGQVRLDDEYIIANATLEYTPTAVFKVTLGSGFSSYELAGSSATLNYYGNLRYEFRPEWFAFVGIKSAQTQTEASTWNNPTGEFQRNLHTAYAKLSVTF